LKKTPLESNLQQENIDLVPKFSHDSCSKQREKQISKENGDLRKSQDEVFKPKKSLIQKPTNAIEFSQEVGSNPLKFNPNIQFLSRKTVENTTLFLKPNFTRNFSSFQEFCKINTQKTFYNINTYNIKWLELSGSITLSNPKHSINQYENYFARITNFNIQFRELIKGMNFIFQLRENFFMLNFNLFTFCKIMIIST
jgi:hypothetical protein